MPDAAGPFSWVKCGLQATIDGATGAAPGGYRRKTAVPPEAWPDRGESSHFPLPIIILARLRAIGRPCAPAASVVASAQQQRNAYECARGVTLPMVSPVWHNGSQLLARVEKVPMAGAKGGFLAKFFR